MFIIQEGVGSDEMQHQERMEVGIFALILAFFLVLLYQTLQLPPAPRQVPLFVLILAVPITVLRILTLLRPGLASSHRIQFFNPSETVDTDEQEEEYLSLKSALVVILWFGAFAAVIYLLGFTIGTFLFVTLFLYSQTDQPLTRSAIAGTLLAAFVHVVFIIGININPLDPVLLPS